MFSLFISFDSLIVFLNQFLFFSLLIVVFLSAFVNLIVSSNSLKQIIHFIVKEIMSTAKMKNNVNLILYLSLFTVFLMGNFVGMVPFNFTISSQLNFCFFFSFLFWFTLMMNNLLSNFFSFLSHLVPTGSPIALSQFMVIIESVSHLIRPLTLGVRLMANMTAGHLIMILGSGSFFLFSFISLPLSMLIFLEIAVALIQAYVFIILLSMYLGEFNN